MKYWSTGLQKHQVGTPSDAFCVEGIVTWATNRVFAFVLVALLSAAFNVFWSSLGLGATFTSFGPRVYERGTGSPTPVVTSFTIPYPSKPYTLRIYNGGRAGIRTGERVSSAIITLNGAVIAGPQNLNEKTAEVGFPIKLLSSNQLSVELRSKPGSLLIVEIVGVNNLPIAHAGPDQTLFVGINAQLDGSGSSDVDGDLLSFQWSLVSRPPGSSSTLSDPTAVKPLFNLDRPGNYQLRLIVNDGIADSAPDTVIISTLNSRPVAYAGPDQTVALGAQVFLDGRDSNDVDGDPLSHRWRIVTKPPNSAAALDNSAA